MFDWIKRKASPIAMGLETEFPMIACGQGGLLGGTHVASNLGWRQADKLAVGDLVLTFDHGMQPITEIHRETVYMPEGGFSPAQCPLFVPVDALFNRVPMWLMPDQGVMLESDLAEDDNGDPFVVVPACALEGYRGIRRGQPGARLELVMPRCEDDQVIYAEAGTLAFNPTPRSALELAGGLTASPYRVMGPQEARQLVVDLMAEEAFWTPDLPMDPGGPAQLPAGVC
jgi:hypothetical protein